MIRALSALLPLLTFVLLWRTCSRSHRREKTVKTALANSFLEASMLWGALVCAASEILSLFQAFHFWGVLLFWAAAALALAGIELRTGRAGKPMPFEESLTGLRSWLFEPRNLAFIGFLLMAIGGTFLTAVQASPNTADSMTYHLSRVAHWAQNRSIGHFATTNLRQLFQCPWAEFAIAQFYILQDGDRLANLVQWFAYPASLAAIALLGAEMGLNSRGIRAAVLFFAAAPMTLLQAATTQNDLLTSFWMLCFVLYFFRFLKGPSLLAAGRLGLALALAVSTKQTACIYALPFLAVFVMTALKNSSRGSLLRIAAVGLIVIGINAGHWSRNFTVFGSPLGIDPSANVNNEVLNAPVLASNIVRNVSIHFGTPFPPVNGAIERSIIAFHRRIGLSPKDPRNNALDHAHYRFEPLSANEDIAGNPVQGLLVVMLLVCVLCFKTFRSRTTLLYLLALIAGFLAICITVKWTPYHTRLHLPLLALASPLIGLFFVHDRFKTAVGFLLAAAAAGSFYWIACSPFRPWTGPRSIWKTPRIEQYFENRPFLATSYMRLTAQWKERGWENIGLLARHSDFEYPLWVLLKSPRVRIEHVKVDNPSSALVPADFRPDVLICTGITGRLTREDLVDLAARYRRSVILGAVYIFDEPVLDGPLPNQRETR